MQATKQQNSPVSKKCTTNTSNNNKPDSNKSVAQRVMEVVNNPNSSNSSNRQPSNYCQTSDPVKASSTNSLCGVNDQEVEDITNRAAKLEVITGHESAAGNNLGDLNNNNNPNNGNNNNRPPESSSSSLLLDSPISSQQQQQSSANFGPVVQPLNMTSLVSSESVFRHIVANRLNDQALASKEANSKSNSSGSIVISGGSSSKQDKETRTSVLDIKVPLPSKSDQFQMLMEEEVSYYNDRPSTSNQENARLKSLAANVKGGHKLSVIVPTSCSQLHHNGRKYLDEINANGDREDEDDYDSRYDNAMVEMRTNHLQFGQQGHNDNDALRPAEVMSVPTSPKAKSAPATPCNVTPIAFHQHKSHLNTMLNPSPANTLPPDLRKNISNTCRVLPSSMGVQSSTSNNNNSTNERESNRLDWLNKQGVESLETKDYKTAIRFFDRCIDLANSQNLDYLKKNYKVYGNRADAYFHLGKYDQAIEDSITARELNPKWIHAYYRQGRAQFLNGQHPAALAILSYGLSIDPKDKRLFGTLVDVALHSNYKDEFEPKYEQLKTKALDEEPFVVVLTLGKELLAKGHGEHAAIILESAFKMGAHVKEFVGSVLPSIGFAYCLIKNYEKAVGYMQKELTLRADPEGQCRVLSNLGYTYFKMGKIDKSYEAHRNQLDLAMNSRLHLQASNALNALAHVHAAKNLFENALTSHTASLEFLKQLGDEHDYGQFKELLSIGHINLMLNDYRASEMRYNEAFQLIGKSRKLSESTKDNCKMMVYFNLAYLALKKQCFYDAKKYYGIIIEYAQKIQNLKFEMRASNGMGQTHRMIDELDLARNWFERQLLLAESLNDQTGKSQALCNLGMIYQHFQDYHKAWKSFDENLRLVEKDSLLKAYALSHLGGLFLLTNCYKEALTYYENSLNIFKDLDYRSTEMNTIKQNIAAVHERMNHTESCLSNVTQKHKKIMTS